MTDLLLEWASYRGSGRRDDIPVDLLNGEQPAWMLADLAALGHIDPVPDGRWRVAPPVLAAAADGAGLSTRGLLCGARTPAILARLRDSSRRFTATLTESAQPGRPAAIVVTARSPNDLPAIAADAGMLFQRDAAFTLLACLPTISNWPRSPCEMVIGHVPTVKRFSRSRLSWVPSSLDEATRAPRGFFRIRREWDWVSVLKEGPAVQSEIELPAGRLAAAACSKKVVWAPDRQQLSLPLALYPPMLIARALVLCSGLLPARDRVGRTVCFQNVPSRIARLTLGLTGLRHA